MGFHFEELYEFDVSVDDPTLLDEDMETEFDESADMGDNDLENDVLSANKVNERCRFWPSCKNGDSCPYSHPCQPCKYVCPRDHYDQFILELI